MVGPASYCKNTWGYIAYLIKSIGDYSQRLGSLRSRMWPASEGAPSRPGRPKSYRGLAIWHFANSRMNSHRDNSTIITVSCCRHHGFNFHNYFRDGFIQELVDTYQLHLFFGGVCCLRSPFSPLNSMFKGKIGLRRQHDRIWGKEHNKNNRSTSIIRGEMRRDEC